METLGLNGVVRIAANNADGTAGTLASMLHVTSFSIEETSETVDTTSMGDASREILATFRAFTGTVDGYWDKDDAAIGHDAAPTAPNVQAGNTITFELHPSGIGTGNSIYEGSAIVTSISRSQSFDGVTEYSITFEGTGDLGYDVGA
mgnify:FL=1